MVSNHFYPAIANIINNITIIMIHVVILAPCASRHAGAHNLLPPPAHCPLLSAVCAGAPVLILCSAPGASHNDHHE
jgi:hypothetical protein